MTRAAVFGGSKKAKKGSLYPVLDLRRGVAAERIGKNGGPVPLKRTVPTATALHAPNECAALTPKMLLLAAARHAIVWLKAKGDDGDSPSPWKIARVLGATSEGSGCFEWVTAGDPDSKAAWPIFGEWCDAGTVEVRAACVRGEAATAARELISRSSAQRAAAASVDDQRPFGWPLLTTHFVALEREISQYIETATAAAAAAAAPAAASSDEIAPIAPRVPRVIAGTWSRLPLLLHFVRILLTM